MSWEYRLRMELEDAGIESEAAVRIVGAIRTGIGEMMEKSDSGMEIRDEIESVRGELDSNMEDAKHELRGEIEDARNELKSEIEDVRNEIEREMGS